MGMMGIGMGMGLVTVTVMGNEDGDWHGKWEWGWEQYQDGNGEQKWKQKWEQERKWEQKLKWKKEREEAFSHFLYYIFMSKSYTYPVSATATYTSPKNNPKSFNSQGRQLTPKILFLCFNHYNCPLYHRFW